MKTRIFYFSFTLTGSHVHSWPCSVNGVTGARDHLPANLMEVVARARAATDKPLSVGFGISSPEQVEQVAAIADGVVVGSAFMKAIDEVRKTLAKNQQSTYRRARTSEQERPGGREFSKKSLVSSSRDRRKKVLFCPTIRASRPLGR